MKSSLLKASLMTLASLFAIAFAEDPQLEQAIKDTQSKLNDPQSRNKLIQQDDKSKKTHQQVLDLTGNNKQQTDDIYSSAAGILGNQKFKSQEEMVKWIEKAQKNPTEFYNNLTDEQKKKISEIAHQIEEGRKKKP